MDREYILRFLQAKIKINEHIIGAAVGSGITAKYTTQGGADFLLALSAGKYRMMGRGSYASYLCYSNNNEIVMELGTRELLPIIQQTPVLFGLFATDPTIRLNKYLQLIKQNGFSGIINFPTMALIDGKFGQVLAKEGHSFQKEVEAIKLAHSLDLFTIAFVCTEQQAQQMLQAGADVICVHLGLTKGGELGAKKFISLNDAKRITERIFNICQQENENILRMIYSGTVNTPMDMQYIYQNTSCQGYIGGSIFERIPMEKDIYNMTKIFKSYVDEQQNALLIQQLNKHKQRNHTEEVKKYIEQHYMKNIHLSELALLLYISPSYLSIKFKKDTGISFIDYLVSYRINKAKELLKSTNISCKEIAQAVGYVDDIQFSKMFKKKTGITAIQYRKREYKHNN
ncbi:phosphoenolpyruvate hydrolase family protein [Lonepinella koalarum]|uniref:AraC family transcriptional regulator n=1 Tax=Lonepinella koalarum TaxID=53417 RepID=A0A4R1KPW6_9PAST|nr:phosphoenolpyruvate hydrolase family protein [Lonepinella koalarum]MDH2925765.1 AraC family transcriptional regulator [Lonepinella koalarum]TCK66567.1 AraC family transcriptional regulator [Lonepinella koalarum]TFJ89034.1 helix-turn-helix domain-containing protein [Lonepinella koalarum]